MDDNEGPRTIYINPILVQRNAMRLTREVSAMLTSLACDLVDVAAERDHNAQMARERNERGLALAKAQQRIFFLEEQLSKALISLCIVQPHDLETPEGRVEHIALTRKWRDEILAAVGWPTGDDWSWKKNREEDDDEGE